MKKEEKLEAVVRLFSKSMFHGDWEWETPNERTIEMLMVELGYWPYENEDDMIAKTHVDEELYRKARKMIPTRPSTNSDIGTKNGKQSEQYEKK
jgi:hypothetical protein